MGRIPKSRTFAWNQRAPARPTRTERKKFAMLMAEDVKPEKVQFPGISGKETSAKKYYCADDIPVTKNPAQTSNPTKLRETITPGTVLVLLAGKFKGRRVVFLKQLESGLLAVTGPFGVNGVPLRRVNQAFVIATSTKVPLSGSFDNITDAVFQNDAKSKKTKKGEFFQQDQQKTVVSEERKQLQKTIDATVSKDVAQVQYLKQYLRSSFSLRKGQYPHMLKF